jgi:hypothetical protein
MHVCRRRLHLRRMGLELSVRAHRSLADALAALAATGLPCEVLMIDGQLRHPTAALPVAWQEARLRTPAGMVTLHRRGEHVSLVVFGNADAALLAARGGRGGRGPRPASTGDKT